MSEHFGVRYVGSPAQVDELSLAVAGDLLVRKVPDQFLLVALSPFLEKRERLLPGKKDTFHRESLVHDADHFLFDAGQVLFGELPGDLHVVVETVLDGRANSQLRAGKQAAHRLSHEMRGGMAQDVKPFFALTRNRLDRHSLGDSAREIDKPLLHLCRHGPLQQPSFRQKPAGRSLGQILRRMLHGAFRHESLLLRCVPPYPDETAPFISAADHSSAARRIVAQKGVSPRGKKARPASKTTDLSESEQGIRKRKPSSHGSSDGREFSRP